MTGAAVAPPDAATPPSPGTGRRRHRLRLVLVFAVLAAAVGFLLAEGLGSSLDYFDTVQQALAKKAAIGTTTIRLEGTVLPGSVHRTNAGADFVVFQGNERVPVHNSGSPPSLFQPDIPVVVVGHFASTSSTVFQSDLIMVKHSRTYVAAHPTRVRAPNGSVR